MPENDNKEIESLIEHMLSKSASIGLIKRSFVLLDFDSALTDSLKLEVKENEESFSQYLQQRIWRSTNVWKSRIAGDLNLTHLFQVKQADSNENEKEITTLDLSRSERELVELFSKDHHCAFKDVFQAAWAYLLYRYSGSEDVKFINAFGAETIGFNKKSLVFNACPIFLDVNESMSCMRLLESITEERKFTDENGTPELSDVSTFSEVRLIHDSLFVFSEKGANRRGKILHSLVSIEDSSVPAIIFVNNDESKKMTCLEVQYSKNYLSSFIASKILEHLKNIVVNFCRLDINSLVSDIAMLTEKDQKKIFSFGGHYEKMHSSDYLVHELVEKTVEAYPDKVALVSGNRKLSYLELNNRANVLAFKLLNHGAGPDIPIGVCMDRTPELVIAMLAILKSGSPYLPLDPSYPEDRIQYMLQDSGAKTVVVGESYTDMFSGDLHKVVYPYADEIVKGAQLLPQDHERYIRQSTKDLAYVIYTSGSTGKPKGVLLQQNTVVNYLNWFKDRFSNGELKSVLFSTSICFDVSVPEIFAALMDGGQVVIAKSILTIASDAQAADITMVSTVPSAMNELIKLELLPDSVMCLVIGGEALKRKLSDEIYRKTNVGAIYNFYGPTECTIYSTYSLVDREAKGEPTIGKPIENNIVYVLDKNFRLAPVGVRGELFLGGANVSRGYLNRSELNATRFIDNPFIDGAAARMYRTGDQAKWNEAGELEFIGRLDHQVKLRGFRIELKEIEKNIMSSDQVEMVVVDVKEDARQVPRLVAYVVLSDPACSSSKGQDEIKIKLNERVAQFLPKYMVPEVYVFLPEIPLSIIGKIDRKNLPIPTLATESETAYQAPTNSIETKLCEQVEKMLDRENVGIDDNFFEIGFQSLLLFRLMVHVNKEFSVKLALETYFVKPTIRELSQEIQYFASKPETQDLRPVPRDRDLLASYAQEQFWIHYQLNENNADYNLRMAFRLEGRLVRDAFIEALNTVIGRHEALRTVLYSRSEKIYQKILHDVCCPIEEKNYTHLPYEAAVISAQEIIDADVKKAFKLDCELPIRVVLVKVAVEKYHVLFNIHHSACDGWSQPIFYEELKGSYNAAVHGNPVNLSKLQIQYADFADWQRKTVVGQVLDSQLSYWVNKLRGAPRMHKLPTDRPRPRIQKSFGHGYANFIDINTLNTFKTLCAENGATLFMGLYTVYTTVLGIWSNSGELLVGTPVANRLNEKIDPLIGNFINSITLKSDLDFNASFSSAIKKSKELIVDGFANSRLPFEKLLNALGIERCQSHNPLFQIWFVFQNHERDTGELTGISEEWIEESSRSMPIHFDLSLSITESDQGLRLDWIFQNDLFEDGTISQLAQDFVSCLKWSIGPKEQVIATAPISLSPKDKNHVQDDAKLVTRTLRGFDINLAEIEDRLMADEKVFGAHARTFASSRGQTLLALLAGSASLKIQSHLEEFSNSMRQTFPAYMCPDAYLLVNEEQLENARKARSVKAAKDNWSSYVSLAQTQVNYQIEPLGSHADRLNGLALGGDDNCSFLSLFAAFILATKNILNRSLLYVSRINEISPIVCLKHNVFIPAVPVYKNLTAELSFSENVSILAKDLNLLTGNFNPVNTFDSSEINCEFVYGNVNRVSISGSDCAVAPPLMPVKTPIRCEVNKLEDAISVLWLYDDRKYHESDIKSLAIRFRKILEIINTDKALLTEEIFASLDSDLLHKISSRKKRFGKKVTS